MLLLVFVGDYTSFMNPKFKLLTAITGAVLAVVGGATFLRPPSRPGISRIVIFLIFIGMLVAVNNAVLVSPESVASLRAPTEEDAQPEIEWQGHHYIKINPAELQALIERDDPKELGGRYVTRGIVKRNSEMDADGSFALVRSTIFCCLADSVALGFRVPYAEVKSLQDGQWAQVYGTLKQQTTGKEFQAAVQTKGTVFTALQPEYVFVPEKVEPTDPHSSPHIFEIREKEPFAY